MKQIIVEGVSPIKLVLSPIEVTLAAKIIAKKKFLWTLTMFLRF